MDKTLYTWLDLYECAIVSDEDNLTLDLVTNLEVSVKSIPRVLSELLDPFKDCTEEPRTAVRSMPKCSKALSFKN